ncbi:hypothetical protein Tco_1162346 [Tanacetum coccineum]
MHKRTLYEDITNQEKNVKTHPYSRSKESTIEKRRVVMDFKHVGKGSLVWITQHHWQIQSWRLYTLSNVHVLETVSGEVLCMFVDISYPLSVKLMDGMLKHKLEINKDVIGNDMTTAEQLIRFI